MIFLKIAAPGLTDAIIAKYWKTMSSSAPGSSAQRQRNKSHNANITNHQLIVLAGMMVATPAVSLMEIFKHVPLRHAPLRASQNALLGRKSDKYL